MKKFRIGVMGGWRGGTFAVILNRDFKEDADIVAICDIREDRLKHMQEELKDKTDVKYFDNFDEFIDCGLDAVVLGNFFHEHAKYAIKALKKGINVISETNAAPTLGECVDLCEAVENSNALYMLAANCPYLYGPMELNKLYNDGTFGRVLYAEGEYFHEHDPKVVGTGDPKHWRQFLPRTYYNMHDLGPLMSITGTMPKKVNAKTIFAPDLSSKSNVGDISAVILTEMDNGAIFRTTSCAGLPPTSKWYRLVCEKGTIETGRTDPNVAVYQYAEWAKPEDRELKKVYDCAFDDASEEVKKSGHANADYYLCQHIIDCLSGRDKPLFDVYRSTALAAAGILAWRSVLEDGKEFLIPDFSDKEERAKYKDDYLTPIPDYVTGEGATLPCSSRPCKR